MQSRKYWTKFRFIGTLKVHFYSFVWCMYLLYNGKYSCALGPFSVYRNCCNIQISKFLIGYNLAHVVMILRMSTISGYAGEQRTSTELLRQNGALRLRSLLVSSKGINPYLLG